MMGMRTKLTGLSPRNSTTTTAAAAATATNGGGGGVEGGPESWELRPCGMLVQKRADADHQDRKPAPTIRVRVKFGSIYHDIYINSQATFGELKKMLTEPTGLHHEDQKVYYKGKERDSKQFLDIVGVKDKSKLIVEEDPISQEKRLLEMRRSAKMEKAAKYISEISLEVDRLAVQVAALETLIKKGGRVAEKEVVNLIELLMNELIKLDGITADGDVKLQRKLQVTRIQKYVETLDVLKVKNSMPSAPNGQSPATKIQEKSTPNGSKPPRVPQRHSIGHSPLKPKAQGEEQPSRHSTAGTVVTTQWETFDSTPPLIPISPSSSPTPKFPWDVFA